MGEKILSVSLMTLVMLFAIDWFVRWYNSFSQKRALDKKIITLLIQLVWVMSALLFWSAMFTNGLVHGFTITHFAFALFIVSIQAGLVIPAVAEGNVGISIFSKEISVSSYRRNRNDRSMCCSRMHG